MTVTIEGIIFDHDGTIVDSFPLVVEATNASLAEAGYSVLNAADVVAGMVLPTTPRMAAAARIDAESTEACELSLAFYAFADAIAPLKTRLYPGIREAIETLYLGSAGMGVLTNNRGDLVRRICAHHGLAEFFPIIFGEEDVPAPKPDGRGLVRMMEALGLEPVETVYVGDSETDLRTARSAGCSAWGVTWGAHHRDELAALGFDLLFDSISDLVSAACRLQSS